MKKVLQHHKDESNKLTSNVGLVANVQQCPLIVYEQFRAAKCKVALNKRSVQSNPKKEFTIKLAFYYLIFIRSKLVCIVKFSFATQ